MEDIEDSGPASVLPPPQPVIQRASLADVRRQEEFALNEGVKMKVHMVGGVYLGWLRVTFVANKDIQREVDRLDKLWRRMHSKPDDYDIPTEVQEDHVRTSWVGRVVHEFGDFEEEAGKPLVCPEDLKARHRILRELLEVRPVRAAVLGFIMKEENFDLKELETTKGNS
jgi:hypothetical protein